MNNSDDDKLILSSTLLDLASREARVQIDEHTSKPLRDVIEGYSDQHFDEYIKNSRYGLTIITPTMVQEVLEAVNLMLPKAIEGPDGRYEIYTSLTNIGRLCGIERPSGPHLKALKGALYCLSGKMLIVNGCVTMRDDAIYIPSRTNTCYHPLEVLRVTEVGTRYCISIAREVLKDRPIIVSRKVYTTMRSLAKGTNQRRLVAQLLLRRACDYDVLVSEVFGISYLLSDANSIVNPTVRNAFLAKAKQSIKNTRGIARRKITMWLDEFTARGLISYDFLGSRGDYRYFWKFIDE